MHVLLALNADKLGLLVERVEELIPETDVDREFRTKFPAVLDIAQVFGLEKAVHGHAPEQAQLIQLVGMPTRRATKNEGSAELTAIGARLESFMEGDGSKNEPSQA